MLSKTDIASGMAPMAGRSACAVQGCEDDVWLVWCFEHCLKPEHRHVRKELVDLATQFGCKFVYHKKSMGFLEWAAGRKGSVLLVADWREAKPIMEELGKQSKNHDALIPTVRLCIVAQTQKIAHRASLWAGNKEITVTLGFSRQAVEKLVASHMQQAVQAARVANPGVEVAIKPVPTTGLSLSSLIQAVRDPKQALQLEQLILQTMWQLYED
mmetsp:Transcript_57749/g.135312  ORF Transcript_57749/g.135312 Transcript_57749/m.135312 type:complete len:213 (+) Transcript_57749:90-728(+)